MGYLSPKGRDWGRVVNWDDLAKFYASFTIAWTVILGIGIGWLILHRHLLFLKIRNIPLAIAATCSLHVYLIKILLAYTVNGHFSCVAEFWIMSIYLPFGIALFQANMVQLQSISGQQKKLLEGRRLSSQTDIIPPSRGIRRFWVKWRAMTELERAEVLIAIGMVVQVCFPQFALYPAFGRSKSDVVPVDRDLGDISSVQKISRLLGNYILRYQERRGMSEGLGMVSSPSRPLDVDLCI